jgi:FkbM family methyltransferase
MGAQLTVFSLARRFLALSPAERGYFLRRFVDQTVHARAGFSQFGEDASIAAYLRLIGRSCRRYIDIGANHPVLHSNTYLFYRDGASGLLVEANPSIAARLRRRRPRDTVLNVAVSAKGGGHIDLHIMDFDGLSTVSAAHKDHIVGEGRARITRTARVPLVGINDLLADHAATGPVDFASLDIEGMDLEVLTAWDFDRSRPFLFSVETGVIETKVYAKDARFAEIMRARGYVPLFETYANTIFVDGRAG